MAGRVDGSQRVNISRAVIEGNAVDLLLPLGTVTSGSRPWTTQQRGLHIWARLCCYPSVDCTTGRGYDRHPIVVFTSGRDYDRSPSMDSTTGRGYDRHPSVD